MQSYIPKLAAAGIVLVIFITMYSTVQQAQRSEANYPQIQLAEDTAAKLDKGDNPLALVYDSIDMKTSLAPFIMVYDKSGKIVIGSGYLKGKVPTVPLGVLKAANSHEYNAITWKPAKDVRIAAVTVVAKDYYVFSGRSLREVEKNETQTLQLTLIGGVLALLLLGAAIMTKLMRREYAPPIDLPSIP